MLTKLRRHSRIHVSPIMRKKLLSILVLSCLVTSALPGCAGSSGQPSDQSSEQPCTLIVYSITGGNVSVMKEGAGDCIEAEVGMSLEPGDTIRCSGSSNAEITFIEGTTIDLETGTEIEIASLSYSAGTGAGTVRVKQTIGSIIFRVTKIVDRASRYEIETPTGVVAVRGSAVQVTVIEDGTTWACNLEGDIWAIAQGVERQIPEGRCCVIRPGQPPRLVCDLTISSSGGGSVTIPGDGTFPYDEGTVVDLAAEAEEGYEFGSWIGDVGAVLDVNAATTTITMSDSHSIRADFEEEAVPYYTLTIWTTSGGSTNPTDGEHMYSEGTVVPVAAISAVGYRFVGWTRDVDTIADVNAASTTITMNDNYSIQANFMAIAPVQYSLSISSGTGGSVTTPGQGTFDYTSGTVVNLVATSDACYQFGNWTGNVGTIANVNSASTTVTMNGDYSITANFEEVEVTFPDPNLEAAVRDAIAIPTGPIFSSDLEGLTTLDASGRNIIDLTGVECATSLTHLDLQSNQVSDISPLANLTSLTWLNLWDNQISDSSPLANLTSLTYLELYHNQMSDISPLANLTSLIHLDLQSNQVSDTLPLANLTSLTDLRLGRNQISDISPLTSLTSLTYLDLGFNQISDTWPLANLTGLTWLVLSSNQISDISPLANLTSLTYLLLGSDQISDISPLANLTNLNALYLSSNQISDISPLANLTNLNALYLYENEISNILPLANLASLTDLDLGLNQISDISPLANLTNLTYLHLGYNQLGDISPLANLTSLTNLLLHNNQISDISPLVANTGLSAGDTVYLYVNPLSSDSLNIYIPQLQARGVTVSY